MYYTSSYIILYYIILYYIILYYIRLADGAGRPAAGGGTEFLAPAGLGARTAHAT